MHRYTSYGLTIASALPLPELRTADAAEPDVRIRLGSERPASGSEASEVCLCLTPREAYLHWTAIGGFRILEGREILVEPSPGVEEALLRLPLLGAVMAV